jgi:hypothetical protein
MKRWPAAHRATVGARSASFLAVLRKTVSGPPGTGYIRSLVSVVGACICRQRHRRRRPKDRDRSARRPGRDLRPGRCANSTGGESAFLRCLRSPLTLNGRLYVETRLRTPSLREQFRLAEGLGEGEMGRRPVSVFRLEGIDTAVAICRPGDESRVYIADGKCLLSELARLARCLRAP